MGNALDLALQFSEANVRRVLFQKYQDEQTPFGTELAEELLQNRHIVALAVHGHLSLGSLLVTHSR